MNFMLESQLVFMDCNPLRWDVDGFITLYWYMVQPVSILLHSPEPCLSFLWSSECKLIYYILLISFSILHKTAKVGNSSLV